MKRHIEIYDTTLRDGSQAEGVNFSQEDKLRLTQALDELQVDYIEGGWPGSNPKDAEYFAHMRDKKLRHATLVAFGSTRRAANPAHRDSNLAGIAAAGVKAACLVGKAWDLHVRDALRVSLEENLDMIESSISWLKKRLDLVFFDAEHFFDGFQANPAYALQTLLAAKAGGADRLILCDTNGGQLPDAIRKGVARAAESLPGTGLGIHCHNDTGLAVANSLAAIDSGAVMLHGCLNGFGERTGNADLCTLIPVLELKLGLDTIGRKNLGKLTPVSRFTYELANLPRRDAQPFVGASAFAHKGGLHVSGISRNPHTYESVAPEIVGNTRRILISELAGTSSILARYPELKAQPGKMQTALAQVRRLEKEGYAFENADASLDLLIRRLLGTYQPSFELLGFRAASEEKAGSHCVSEASVKVRIGDLILHTVSEAEHGPVSALDLALRKALSHVYPQVEAVRLTDYRVHIVNAMAAANANVRVVIQSRDGDASWGTLGVSENILLASCQALVDSLQYALLRRRKKGGLSKEMEGEKGEKTRAPSRGKASKA
ncbi:MAG: citramalate synthase [Planctomycetota bacterium]|jgi:2-isopropylmalate synthase|nr:citramalate synthase [Planctomycetota bacterium]